MTCLTDLSLYVVMNSSQEYVDFCRNASSNDITSEIWELGMEYEAYGLVSAVFKTLIILLGLPLNLLVLVAIIKDHLYHQPTIILLMSLALSDLMVLVFSLPFEVSMGYAGEFIFGDSDYRRCRICLVGVTHIAFTLTSVFTVVLMSFDRFIFIYKPLHYEMLITPTRTVIAACLLWVLTFVLLIFPIAGQGDVIFFKPFLSCTIDFSLKNSYYYLIVFLLVCTGIIMLLIFNIWVICIVLKNIKAIYKDQESSRKGKNTGKDRSADINKSIFAKFVTRNSFTYSVCLVEFSSAT